LPATLIEIIYHGVMAKLVFGLNGGEQTIAQLRAGNPMLGMDSGTSANLSFDAKDARVYAPEVQEIQA